MQFIEEELRSLAQVSVKRSGEYASTYSDAPETTFKRILRNKLHESVETKYDIFLSHSFLDAELVYGIKNKLESYGYSVYVDWIVDEQLDRNKINKDTADILRMRLRQSKCLLYANTKNSEKSKWMPWELGFMDGNKTDKVSTLAIKKRNEHEQNIGQEYLGLYPTTIEEKEYTYSEKKSLFIIYQSEKRKLSFREWLMKGSERNNSLTYTEVRHLNDILRKSSFDIYPNVNRVF